MKTETYNCAGCGIEVTRPVARGQRPKWCTTACGDLARKAAHGMCQECKQPFFGMGTAFCSKSCAATHGNRSRPRKPKPARKTPEQIAANHRALWSPLRRAIADDDNTSVLKAIRADCTTNANGCWIWGRRLKDGYPTVHIAGRVHHVHRLSLEAALGAHLGSQQAHHKCATSSCVNPDHLQPITHRENIAEMMARHAYLARIRELEDALRSVAPTHQLLGLIAVA